MLPAIAFSSADTLDYSQLSSPLYFFRFAADYDAAMLALRYAVC